MASGCDFEASVSKFTESRTGIKTRVDLVKGNTLVIRPVDMQGCVSLGDFWIKVLQHPQNYPVYSHESRKLYRARGKYELQLRIDGISLTVDLASGCFTLEGSHVIDWTLCQLPGIMQRYSLIPESSSQFTKYFTKQEMADLQQERERCYSRYVETWPVEAHSADLLKAGSKNLYHEPVDPDGYLEGTDLETYSPKADLMEKEEVEEQLKKLTYEYVTQGCVLYRLWRSALNLWFSDKNARVFIVTSHIDHACLTDICQLFLNNKLTACVDTLSVPFGNLYRKFADVRQETIKQFSPQDQVLIEYKIYQKCVYPVKDYVTSFIAAVRENKASILRTNIHFDRTSFVTANPVSALFEEVETMKFVKTLLALGLIKN